MNAQDREALFGRINEQVDVHSMQTTVAITTAFRVLLELGYGHRDAVAVLAEWVQAVNHPDVVYVSGLKTGLNAITYSVDAGIVSSPVGA